MATDRNSWHSVNEVTREGIRCCVSNYYFSPVSPEEQPYFHVTSFRNERARGLIDRFMRAANGLRTAILKASGNSFYKKPHVYTRSPPEDEAL